MRIYPVLVDSRPAYLGEGSSSILLSPTGRGSVLEFLAGPIVAAVHTPVLVLSTFEPTESYCEAIRDQGIEIEDVVSIQGFATKVGSYALSDSLLLWDARRVGYAPLLSAQMLEEAAANPGVVRHLVLAGTTPAGTSERVLVDPHGRVSRIQRYYESVTWPFASGVICSIVPLASASMLRTLSFHALNDLRSALTAAHVPSQDTLVDATTFDLGSEGGLLSLVDRIGLDRSLSDGSPRIAPTASVDPSAIVRGAVVLEDGVCVERNAVLVGPAVVGRGSRIGAGAVVAHAVVASGTSLPDGFVLRQRVASPDRLPEDEPRIDPDAFSQAETTPPLDEMDDPNPFRQLWRLKTPVEIVLAALALLILSPLLVLIALLVKLESRGPVLYGDRREGYGGRVFRCWKFRTMIQGADARQRLLARKNQMDGPQFKLDVDPRVTRMGRILRPLSLDELPQLLNVAAGEMSLVGPRPSPFRENQLCIPWREARLSVRPGITGLWQVCRHDRADGDFHQWIYYDMLYVRHMTPWVDLKIVLATIITLGGRTSVPLSSILPRSRYYDRRQQLRVTAGTDRRHDDGRETAQEAAKPATHLTGPAV